MKVNTCVLNLPINEGQGSTAHDSSGYGNHGTIYGATWVNGSYGYGLYFDGTDDYVDCGNDSSLDITDAITIEAWVKPNTLLTDDWETQDIIAKYHHNYGIDERSGYQLNIQNIGSTYYNRFSVYIGKNATWATVYSNTELWVGRSEQFGRTFNGTIAEVRIYNRAWTADEVLSYYNATKGRFGL